MHNLFACCVDMAAKVICIPVEHKSSRGSDYHILSERGDPISISSAYILSRASDYYILRDGAELISISGVYVSSRTSDYRVLRGGGNTSSVSKIGPGCRWTRLTHHRCAGINHRRRSALDTRHLPAVSRSEYRLNLRRFRELDEAHKSAVLEDEPDTEPADVSSIMDTICKKMLTKIRFVCAVLFILRCLRCLQCLAAKGFRCSRSRHHVIQVEGQGQGSGERTRCNAGGLDVHVCYDASGKQLICVL
jgi:hypothetical protein